MYPFNPIFSIGGQPSCLRAEVTLRHMYIHVYTLKPLILKRLHIGASIERLLHHNGIELIEPNLFVSIRVGAIDHLI